MLQVKLNANKTRFVAIGGDAKGGDSVNKTVTTWPGWARLPGRRAVGSVYAGPLSAASALALSSTTLHLDWEGEARQRAGDLLKAFRDARDALENGKPALVVDPSKRNPHPFQARGVAAMELLGGRVLLADHMGLGKTAQALWLAERLGQECSRVLVLCPASVKFNWRKEVSATLGETWPCQVIDGHAKKRANQFAELDSLWRENQRLIIVINYDLLAHLTENQLQRLTLFAGGQMIALDEVHYLKNKDSNRTKIVRKYLCPSEGGARWRIGMSGTPIFNTVEDLYSEIELIQPGTFYSLAWFLERFTVQSVMKIPYKDKRGRDRVLHKKKVRRVRNEKELNVILNTIQIRRRKEDVTDLPPKVFTYPELELDTPHKKIYAAMRDYALLLLGEQDERMPVLSPVCRTAVEAAARCEQIAQGCVGGVPEDLLPRMSGLLTKSAERVTGKPGWLVFPKHPKILWLREQLQAVQLQEGRSLTFARFNAPLLWLAEQSEGTGYAVTGELGAAQRQALFDDFQAGDIQELYIQVRIAQGFNLQRAQDVFFLGRDWAPAMNAQAVDRAHRIGQKGTVNVQIPIVRGTIEVRQNQALSAKEQDAASALCFQTIADLKEALS